jgi:hypothetical protein
MKLGPEPPLDDIRKLTLVGYGATSATDTAGARRRAVVPLASSGGKFFQLGAGKVPCHGDSGGPVLVERDEDTAQLVGLVSFTTGGCEGRVRVTRLGPYVPMLRRAIESNLDL